MFKLVGTSKGAEIKTRNYSKMPTSKMIRSIRDRWDNDYGAYLTIKLYNNLGQEVCWVTNSIKKEV